MLNVKLRKSSRQSLGSAILIFYIWYSTFFFGLSVESDVDGGGRMSDGSDGDSVDAALCNCRNVA